MSVADDKVPVLPAIAACPPEEALSRLRARGDAAALIMFGADEAEKLVMTDLKRALEASDLLVRVSDLVGAAVPAARSRRARAQSLAYANRFDDALLVLEQAVALAEGAGDRLEAARARMTSLHALARLGRYAEAIQAGEAAREAFVASGEALLAARADINLGVTRRMSDDPERAIAHFERSRPALHDQPMLMAQMESNRAEALLDLNRFDQAERAFTEALNAFRRAGAARAAAIVEGNLADLTARQGRLDAAFEHFERARRQFGDTDAPGDVARLRAEQAEALAALGMFTEAAEQFAAAVPVLLEHKLAWEHARARAGLGWCFERLGRDAEASVELEAAAGAFETLGHGTGASRVRVLQAELAQRAGDIARAEAILARATPALAERPALAAIARLARASVLAASGRTSAAREEIDAGLKDAQRLGLAPLAADFLQLRAQVRRADADLPGAIADLRDAIAQVERVRGTLRAERLRAAFLGDRARLFETCVSVTLDAGGAGAVPAAFEVTERARSRSLLDALQAGNSAPEQAAGHGDDEAPLLAEMSRLRAEMNALYAGLDDGLSRPRAARDPARWSQDVARLEHEMTVAEGRLAVTSRYAPVFSRPRGLEEIRAVLAPEEVLLQFFAEGDHLSVMVVRPDGAGVHRRIVALASVDELVRAFGFQVARAIARSLPGGSMGDRLRGDAERALDALYTVLIGPIESEIRGASRLVIAPHGSLHAVPFHALMHAGLPLLERFEIVLTPSASIWSHLISRADLSMTRPRLVVGVADALAPEAETEARALGGGPGATLLVGSQATIAGVKDAAAGAGMIHFAGHARFSPGDPLNSGLRLADGWLTAREISGLRLEAPTIVLSACDTGRSEVSRADEIWGLVRAFLVAGASTLIISLWPAHDRTSAETMAAFHAERYSGGAGGRSGSARSLRVAQQLAARRGLHPAAWANFLVIGKP